MVTGGLVDIDGELHYRIDGIEQMAPFLTTVVSHSDLWMFASSAGTLTAGRRDPDHALLPYETDDRLHRAVGVTGPITIVARTGADGRETWTPFDRRVAPGHTRALARSALGHRLVLEEHHPTWQVTFRTTWEPADSFGWVRTVELVDESGAERTYEVLDGLLGIVPAGIDATLGQIRSNLADAYKRSERLGGTRAAIYSLEALVTDRAEPAEALTATVLWSSGLDGARVALDEGIVADMLDGRPHPDRDLLVGGRGSYLLRADVTVPAGDAARWRIVADTDLDHAGTNDRVAASAQPGAIDDVVDDVAAGAERLRSLVDAADARQATGDPVADAHHLSNVLFNSMRGGVFPFGHSVPLDDFADFVRERNRHVHARHAEHLAAAGGMVSVDRLHALVDATGDPDLVRLGHEYLPLTFSRRHGDPSRPWNRFSIGAAGPAGEPVMSYEGNWRDIFQNWEALLVSYPAFAGHAVAAFVNASTRDGYNPYRISRTGIDWEVPDPDDPWSHIGYWGDHQIVYLFRLLELWERYEPGALDRWLDRRVFVYADVPYTIHGHDDIVRDPRNTITFDLQRAAAIDTRTQQLGGDGRLAVDRRGELVRVGLFEKLLVPTLAKLSNLVPGGGIWMNTQRPEWNDANNALAGPGLSLVTLYQLRPFLGVLARLVDRAERGGRTTIPVTSTVASWLDDVTRALAAPEANDAVGDPRSRRSLVDTLGRAAEAHRQRLAAGTGDEPVDVELAAVARLCTAASTLLDGTIAASRRPDGLFHSYDRISFPDDRTAHVDHLGLMLEGQVAILSSGVLSSADALDLVDALFESDLHRADQQSFLLYPYRPRPSFLGRNIVPADRVAALGAAGDLLVADDEGGFHFRADLVNGAALEVALDRLDPPPSLRSALVDLYEEVFDHRSFTGRSGTMYGYEGLGSIYWHMVAKLLLAVQEGYWAAVDRGEPDTTIARWAAAYRRVRDGLGFRKDPATYGAPPTDCYSHTPAHRGAQQPGMTGQVKEEILTRLGELGYRVVDGRARLQPGLLPLDELLATGPGGERTATFTVAGVPHVVRLGDTDTVAVVRADGSERRQAGCQLGRDDTRDSVARDGTVARVEWTISAAR